MKKEVLIITNYYPPEIGAASNRIRLLALGLTKHDFRVRVVTPLPNYPNGKIFSNYAWKIIKKDVEEGVRVHRLWLFASNSRIKLLRFLAMISYSFSLIVYFLTHKIPNRVIIQSPPLIVAFFSVLFLNSKKRKVILNVSDLWPLAGYELGAFKKNITYKILEKIAFYNYRKSDLILGQSNEILAHIKTILPSQDVMLYRNFPKIKSVFKPFKTKSEGQTLHIVYAGLLGVAQGIHRMLNELDFSKIHLHIYGAGAEKKDIEAFIKGNNQLPITYYGSVSRDHILRTLPKYHVAIIPLLNRIYGSVPSKIFELGLLGVPMIYFGGGEGEQIIKEYNLGWVAEAGNYKNLNDCIKAIDVNACNNIKRKEIIEIAEKNFNFEKQLAILAAKL